MRSFIDRHIFKLILFVTVFGSGGWLSLYFSERSIMYEDVVFETRMHKLKKNYIRFQAMSATEFHVKWWIFFNKTKYKLNGNIRHKKYDCSLAVFDFIRAVLGGDPIMETSTEMGKRLALHVKPRQSIYQVKPKDLMIFHQINGIGHVAFVERVYKGYIYYVDVNAPDGGKGYKKIAFKKLKAIYEMPFQFFASASLVI